MMVVAGLAVDADCRRVLMGLRPPGKLRPSMWEYPGGKIEQADRDLYPDAAKSGVVDVRIQHAALVRELREELGVAVVATRSDHIWSVAFEVEEPIHWSLFPVLLSGEPKPLAHVELRWVEPEDAIKNLSCTPTTYLVYRAVKYYLNEVRVCGPNLRSL